MSSGTTTPHGGGFVHEVALYGSDDEFLSLVVPFLRQGVAAGEPTLVALAEPARHLLRSAIGDPEGIVYLDEVNGERRPARLIETNRGVLSAWLEDGGGPVRALGETPHPGLGVPWHEWARYEAVINHAYATFPLWRICPFDTRTASDEVVADVLRTHPRRTVDGGRHVANPRFQEPTDFLARRTFLPTEPAGTSGAPAVELRDPTPEAARHAARAACGSAALAPGRVQDLVLAVSEAVSNAVEHGRPPVRLRMWTRPGRVVAVVGDTGSGPRDPYCGLLPGVSSAVGGFGLWVVHQVCDEITLHRTASGYALRLVCGASGGDGEV